jgi:hypothetical protein
MIVKSVITKLLGRFGFSLTYQGRRFNFKALKKNSVI